MLAFEEIDIPKTSNKPAKVVRVLNLNISYFTSNSKPINFATIFTVRTGGLGFKLYKIGLLFDIFVL